MIAVGAGADTTATALAGVFYYLLSNRAVFDRLQKEVDSIIPPGDGDPFDTVKLANMPYLNAVM